MTRGRLVLALVLALAPWLAGAAETGQLPLLPTQRFAVELGVGPAQTGAPSIHVGLSAGLFETVERRVELRGTIGFPSTQEPMDPGYALEPATYNGVVLVADLLHAWRYRWLEPWVSVGVARVIASLDDPAFATGPARTDLATQIALGAGVRIVVGQFALSLDGAWTPQVRSQMAWLSPTPFIGGASLSVTAAARFGPLFGPPTSGPASPAPVAGPVQPPSAPPRVAASPEPPPEPAAPPQATAEPPAPPPPEPPPILQCAPGERPAFAVHAARAFRCRPNPVAGGFTCEPHQVDARRLDAEGCAAACARDAPACAEVTTAAGAACARCAAECRRPSWAQCAAANGGTLDGVTCVLDPGRWAPGTLRVPAACRPLGADGEVR
jgi:hypothetical protein